MKKIWIKNHFISICMAQMAFSGSFGFSLLSLSRLLSPFLSYLSLSVPIEQSNTITYLSSIS